MNQRERHAMGGVAIAPPPEADISPPGSRPPSEPPVSPALIWDQLIDRLSLEQQRHLMNLAHTQGFVLTSQIPDLPTLTNSDGKPRNLVQWLATPPNSLPPLPILSRLLARPESNDDRAEIVGLALENPDLFLLQCLPRTEKPAIVRAILNEALARKWRVLYLASSVTVDRLFQELPGDPTLRLRCLAREERVDQLHPTVASCTLSQREKSIHETAVQRSRKNLETAQESDARLRELDAILTQLSADTARLPEVRQQIQSLTERTASLESEITAISQSVPDSSENDLKRKLRELHQHCEAQCCGKVTERDRLHEECQQYERELEEARSQVDQVRNLCEAKLSNRWWSASFWKAKFDKSLPEKSVHAEEVQHHLEEVIQTSKTQIANFDLEIQKLHRERDQEIRTLLENELRARSAETSGELERGRAEEQRLIAGIERNRARIATTLNLSINDIASTPVDSIRETASSRLKENEQELLFARRWFDFLNAEGETLVRQNRTSIPLVAGPFASVQADPFFGDAAVRNTPFDLLLIDEASYLQEGDFNHAISKAKRTVLISEAGEPDLDADRLGRAAKGSSRYSVAPKKKADVFERLWNRFFTPIWTYEGKRLVAHLVPLLEDQLRFVERESVADNPMVELRIYTPEVGEPCLSAVAFAPGMTPAQAHQFLHTELGEVLAFPISHLATWSEAEGLHRVRFGNLSPREEVFVEEGVRQQLNGIHTVGFSFESSTWSQERAVEWLHDRRAKHPTGKAVRLEVSPRIDEPYSQWLNDLFRIGYRVTLPPEGLPPSVRFIKVPEKPLVREAQNGPQGDRRSPAPRLSGAGLEMDLSDARRRSDFPAEWASVLPAQGLINRAEAEALIQQLPSVRREHPDRTIGISSLYPAQLALLRHLLNKSGLGSNVKIIDPHRLDSEGCDLLLLSLTRSHVSRAVTFGDHPRTIQKLLSHVRSGLYLFGDLGTISRRAGWEGACDQLDEEAGSRERDWVNMLLRYLNGKGPHPTLFQVIEGARHDG